MGIERGKGTLNLCEPDFAWLFESAKDGILLISPNSGEVVYANQAFTDMSGYSREEIRGKKLWETGPLAAIDVSLIVFRELHGQEGVSYDDLPLETKSGRRITIELFCGIHSLDGRNVIQCTIRDITERKRIEEELRRAETKFRALFRNAGVGIVIEGADERIIEANRKIEGLFGYSAGELYGMRLSDVAYSGDRSTDEALYQELMQEKRDTYQVEKRFIRKDGGQIWGLVHVSRIGDAPKPPRYVVRIVEDITARKRAEEELKRTHTLLERQATVDSLTGIFNRLKFNELFDREIQEVRRYRRPLSLIMFDVDRFKSINDTYGHLVGDAVLKEIARLVSANIRSVDIFARWGGEEFMILSPNNELKSAQQMTEKLRVEIEKEDFSCPCKLTCSFGLAQFREDDTADSFINRVDDALYRAKARGRNSVETGYGEEYPNQEYSI